MGQAYLNSDEQQSQYEFSIHTPKSEWITRLKTAGFMDILLLEVPFPISGVPEHLETVQHALEEAQRHFMSAEYTACVASCRTAVQELGHYMFDDPKWSDGALKHLNDDAKSMAKDDREKALFAVIRHYTHQAHHGNGEGGARYYTRSEARMILQMAAAAMGASSNFM
jgi:hypothetical protein